MKYCCAEFEISLMMKSITYQEEKNYEYYYLTKSTDNIWLLYCPFCGVYLKCDPGEERLKALREASIRLETRIKNQDEAMFIIKEKIVANKESS